MNVPWQSPRQGQGLLLLRGEPDQVARWARRGLVATTVVGLPGWTAAAPAEQLSRARPPYDDALTVLASRPVAHRLRAAIGLFAIDGRAVVTVHGGAWRAVPRWLVWQPGSGVARPPALPLARPGDLVAAAGVGGHGVGRGVGRDVAALLGSGRGDALSVLAELMALLGLPGAPLLTGDSRGEGTLVEPAATAVARFDALTLEDARHRAELEED